MEFKTGCIDRCFMQWNVSERRRKRRCQKGGTVNKERAKGRFRSTSVGRTILLMSEDRALHEALRSLANERGHLVIRANGAIGSVAILEAIRPAVVLLDLDLPRQAAWELAEGLLACKACPRLILLTGRKEPFDPRTARRIGRLLNKNAPVSRLLEAALLASRGPILNQAERNAIRRALIRRLRPFRLGGGNHSGSPVLVYP
jgi:CheY-like chemotaxis protein